MKKIFFPLALGLLLAGCDYEDSYTPGAAATTDVAVGFTTDNVADVETDESSVTLTLQRNSAEGTLTVPLAITENGEGVLQAPTEVTFQDGETTAELVIDIVGAENGGTYQFAAQIADGFDYNPYKMEGLSPTFSMTVHTLVWDVYHGAFEAEWWIETDEAQDVVVKHLQGSSTWRLMAPFDAYVMDMGVPASYVHAYTCEYIQFYVAEDGTVSFDTFYFFPYDDENNIYGFYPSTLAASVAAYDAYTKLLSPTQIQFAPYAYVPGLGGWGVQPMYLTLTDGEFLVTSD